MNPNREFNKSLVKKPTARDYLLSNIFHLPVVFIAVTTASINSISSDLKEYPDLSETEDNYAANLPIL